MVGRAASSVDAHFFNIPLGAPLCVWKVWGIEAAGWRKLGSMSGVRYEQRSVSGSRRASELRRARG
jgi:hypothetical protein